MKKRYIIGGLIIAFGVLAGFLISKNATAPAGPETTETATTTATTTTVTKLPVKTYTPSPSPIIVKNGSYLVSYKNSGFTPVTLTIKRGKSVSFVNNSDKAMSITAVDQNSNVYRQLNQEQSVGRGGTYDFTFTDPGIWVYTNRNNPAVRGTIIVE